MLDLIIPVYNNKIGLYRTLMSIGVELEDKVYVTVVDDGSDESYDEIITLFAKFFPIRLITLDKNSGPGIARQYGLDTATQPYVSFIDCGDTFINPNTLQKMLNTVKLHDDCIAFFWSHTEEYIDGGEGSVGSGHNRMHGKIYLRQWLIDNNITFSQLSPRANEDIGFNLAIRLIDQQYIQDHDGQEGRIFISEEDVIRWTKLGPSIVRDDNCAYYYRDQNMGLALNAEHAINIAKQAGVCEEIITIEANTSMAYEYVFYLATQANRPQYLKQALAGALYYYQHVFRYYRNKNYKHMCEAYYRLLGDSLTQEWHPLHEKLIPMDYEGFLNKLEELSAEMDLMGAS